MGGLDMSLVIDGAYKYRKAIIEQEVEREKRRRKENLNARGMQGGPMERVDFEMLLEETERKCLEYCELIRTYCIQHDLDISTRDKEKYQEEIDRLLNRIGSNSQEANRHKDKLKILFSSTCDYVNFAVNKKYWKGFGDKLVDYVLKASLLVVGAILGYFLKN